MSNEIPTPFRLAWVRSASFVEGLNAAAWLNPTDSLRKMGWDVTLIGEGKPEGYHQVWGVDVYCIPKPNVYLVRQAIFHIAIIRHIWGRSHQIDIVLFNEMSTPWMLLYKLLMQARKGHKPLFVMDTRTLPMEKESTARFRDKIRGKYYLWMNVLANHFADGRMAITQRMADTLNIPPEKLWGVRQSGVDAPFFLPARENRKPYNPGSELPLIYIGFMGHERNLLELCQAVVKAKEEGMPYKFTLIGNGPAWDDLKQFASTTDGCVEVLPSVHHEQIPGILAKAYVGVLPFPDELKFRVCSPIKLFEYMAAGMPILATRIVCHTDVVGDGKFAFWAESADVEGLTQALRSLWKRRGEINTMGSLAAEASYAWTWQESAARLKRALEAGMKKYGQRI